MFLLPQRLIHGAELFNIKQNEDLKHYNKLLAEVGRSVRILSEQRFMVGGAVAPANEFGEGVMKPDALYLYVTYERTKFSPYKPMFEMIREGCGDKYRARQDQDLVIEVDPGDDNQSVLKKIEDAAGRTIHYDPENIVIDVTSTTKTVKEKPLRRKGKAAIADDATAAKAKALPRAKKNKGTSKSGTSPRSNKSKG